MINVIGLGYIGLPTALIFAAYGHKVVGTDYNQEIIEKLNAGKITFEEKGLKELYSSALARDISFSTEYHEADYYIVSVPTPYDEESKQIDASYIVQAVSSILNVCPDESCIIIESTVSPGTIDRFVRPLTDGKLVHLVHAPERIIPGNMIYELINNSRTIGADDLRIAENVKKIYESFCEAEIAVTSIRTAELTKIAENTFRDVNIAYANELARICHEAKLDVYELIRIANMHPRVNILQPGPGVGGHCISVDPWFLVGDFPQTVDVVRAARRVNDGQPVWIFSRIQEIMVMNNIESFSQVGIYGLTYKENVDDTRESPTMQLLKAMGRSATSVVVYDPFIREDIVNGQCHSLCEFLENIKLVVIMVGHDEIKEQNHTLKQKIVFDTRRICNISQAISL